MTGRQPDLLVLVCAIETCRWRPPNDLVMDLVQAHFDLEDDHDPNNIRLDLVAWCYHCNTEMVLFRSQDLGQGTYRHYYLCRACRRTRNAVQETEPPDQDPAG